MGVVWAAINELTSREVALKLILRSTPDMRVRLMREAQACGKLAHRNIIEVFDVGVTDTGDPFLIMPLLAGENLAQRLERQRRIEPVMAARIARDVARALEAAHAASIIHRDLKPANIFLHQEAGTDGVVVKVLDFGVSKDLASTEAITTVAGGPVGSPAYMSPEQFRVQRDLDPRTDLWSLGAVLFEMLTGSRAFQGDAAQVMQQVLTGEVPRVSKILWRADPKLDAIVARCLERSRDRRFQSAGELARELDEFLGEPSHSRADSSVRASSSPSFERSSDASSRAAAPPNNPFPLSPSAAGSLEMLDDDNVATVPVDLSLIAGLVRGPVPPAPPPPEPVAPARPAAGAHVPTLASPTVPIDPRLTSTTPLDPMHVAPWHGGRARAETSGGSSAPPPSVAGGGPPSAGLGGTVKLPPDLASRTPTWGHLPAVDAAPSQPPVSHPRSGDASMTTGAASVVQVPSGPASVTASDAARLAALSSSPAPLAEDRSAGKRLMVLVSVASAVVVAALLLLVLPSGGGDAQPGAGVEAAPTGTAAVPSAPVAPAPSAPEQPKAATPPGTADPATSPAGTQVAEAKPPVAAPPSPPSTAKPGNADGSPILKDVPWDMPKPKPTVTAPKPPATAPKPPATCGKLICPKPSTPPTKVNPTRI